MSRNIPFLTLCSLAALALPLSGCASWWSDDNREIAETIEINQPDLPSDTQMVDLAAAQVAMRTNAPKTMGDSAALMSNQGVQVYGLTGAAPAPVAIPSNNAPRGFDVTPNVEIFPLDGAVNQPAMNQPSFTPPAYAPKMTHSVPHHDTNHGDVIYFEHGGASLDNGDMAVIRRVAQNFRASGKSVLSVEGHASTRTGYSASDKERAVNMKMSMERAYAVADALVRAGVPAQAVKTVAWGDTHPPVAGGTTYGAESTARRVEIIAQ